MFNFFAVTAPAAIGLWLTYMQFKSFYEDKPALLLTVMAFTFLFSLLVTLPTLKLRQKSRFIISLLFPYAACLVFFYNRLVFYAALVVCVFFIIPARRVKRGVTTIDFINSGDMLVINRYIRRTPAEVYAYVTNGFMVLTLILLALTFMLPNPTRFWYARAFLQEGSPEAICGIKAVPSGRVTEAVWYNDKSMLVGGFFDIETSEGTIKSPCLTAGLKEGDVITKIDGTDALDSAFITNGPTEAEIKLEVMRPNSNTGSFDTLSFSIKPAFDFKAGTYRIGINYYSGASLGVSVQTVSFYYPAKGHFAATAHSFEELLDRIENRSGAIFSAAVAGRDLTGLAAIPIEKIGSVNHADAYGSYGVLEKRGAAAGETGAFPIALKSEARRGKAYMMSSFEGVEVRKYDVYITGTYRIAGRDVLTLNVEDERIKDFGGVTRGMSGSPIIQNGKIIGALSNMDEGGVSAYATYACDMADRLNGYFNL